MVDGLPLHLHEQRRHRNGQVRQHEQGKRQRIQYLFPAGRVDASPLAGGGDAAQHQQCGQNTAHTFQQGAQSKPRAVSLRQPQHRQRQVGQQAQGGEDKGRQDGHGHVEAAPAALGGSLQQLRTVPAEHLYIALCPAQTLAHGLAEVGGLLVVQHRVLADGDLLAPQDVVHGKLNILRQQIEPPAAALRQYPPGEQEPGAAHGGAGAQPVAGAVEIPALPQEPQGVARADPVIAEILAVAIAGDDLVTGGERLVHPLDVVRRQQVVRVEHEVAVKALRIVRTNVLQKEVQRVALAYVHMVEPLVHHRAVGAGDGGGAVGAVVRRHEHRDQGHVVGLGGQRIQQPGDDILLVPGGDQHRVPVGRCRERRRAALFQQHQRYVQELIGVADEKQCRYNGIDGTQNRLHGDTFLSLVLRTMVKKVGLRNKQRAH